MCIVHARHLQRRTKWRVYLHIIDEWRRLAWPIVFKKLKTAILYA